MLTRLVRSIVSLALLASCASRTLSKFPAFNYTSPSCRTTLEKTSFQDSAEKQLNSVSNLFDESCFNEVISLGSWIRQQHRDKFYSLQAELAEVLVPEGTFTEYVMESHERAYLSLLISWSYLRLNRENEALVELRKSQEEIQAQIYNYGNDHLLTMLQAALWDRFDPSIARPYWKLLSEKSPSETVQNFAALRIKKIDQNPSAKVKWRMFGLGQLPALTWESQFFTSQKNPYSYTALTGFPPICSTSNGLMMSTAGWVNKMGSKYASAYHPLLFTRSLARLPVAVTYSVATATAGVGIAVGGCVAASPLREVARPFCALAIQTGGRFIVEAPNVMSFTLAPDMRHWSEVPSAFYITTEESDFIDNTCLNAKRNAWLHTRFVVK